MRFIQSFLLFILGTPFLNAQTNGTIKYTHTLKLEINMPEGMDVGNLIPQQMTTLKELTFSDQLSLYKDAEENVSEDVEMESDDGSFKMTIESSDSEEILFTDLKAKRSMQQTSFMDKDFLIESIIERPKWKITSERIKYLGYVCQKATMVQIIPANEDIGQERKEKQITAWFTSEIPVPIGPDTYNQLPGAILLLSIDGDKTEIKATEINIQPADEISIDQPTTGQKVSREEYEKIMTAKLKELESAYGGNGSTFMIKG